MYRVTDGRASVAEPMIWFRILHAAVDSANDAIFVL